MQDIGMLLRKKRRDLDMPQWQAAEKIGVCQSMISIWERGIQEIPEERLKALLRVYGVTLRELMEN